MGDMGAELSMAARAKAAAMRSGDGEAARFLRDGTWTSLTYAELWARVRAVAHGLVGLGVEPGDRVAVLSGTRVEFTIAELAVMTAGGVVVPVYPTSSADECRWVIGDSGATVLVCEAPEHAARVDSVRADLPGLRHTIIIDGTSPGTTPLADLEAAAAAGDDAELDRRIAAADPDDVCLIIYTSGTTGRPKGVVLTHRNLAAARHAVTEVELFGPGDVVYLYLPLAHAFAQLVQAACVDVGAAIAYFGGDTTQIVGELAAVQPTVLPSVPRVFEKVYSVAMGMVPPGGEADARAAIELGLRVREARARGEDVDPDEAAEFERLDGEMFALVRSVFGGRMRFAVSGAAPIAPEILQFFFATGVPVYEGWGMTETTSIGTLNLPDAYRLGTIGRPVLGTDVRIAEDGEIEVAGDIVMREYWNNPTATKEVMTDDGYLRTGDIGSIDDDGFVTITGRKKEIIITAGGKNLTPANLEGDLRRSRWISQAVMFGDRRPYPVALITLDAEVILPWAEANGLPTDLAELSTRPEVRELIQAEVDAVNANYAQVEQIKRFAILPRDFTLADGELTPSLKLKRNVVYESFAQEFDDLYR